MIKRNYSSINQRYRTKVDQHVRKGVYDNRANDMAQRIFKFSTNITALKRAIFNNDKEEVKSMLTTLQKDKDDFEK